MTWHFWLQTVFQTKSVNSGVTITTKHHFGIWHFEFVFEIPKAASQAFDFGYPRSQRPVPPVHNASPRHAPHVIKLHAVHALACPWNDG